MKNTDLVKESWLEKPPVQQFSASAITEVIAWVAQQASVEASVDTQEGRKQIASTSAKVSSTKVFIDSIGKDLVSEWKKSSKHVDVQRKRVRDELDALRDSVREPLTKWENAEKERRASLEARIEDIVLGTIFGADASSADLKDGLAKCKALVIDESYQEYQERAQTAKDRAVAELIVNLDTRLKHEADQAELLKLRKEAAAREVRDREEQIRSEAIAKAQSDAKAAAKAKAEQDRLAIERAQAEQAAAEARTKRAAEQHAAELVAIKERQEQAEIERVRKIENEAEARRVEQMLRDEDERYQTRIANEITFDLVEYCGIFYGHADAVLAAIKTNRIRHVVIQEGK